MTLLLTYFAPLVRISPFQKKAVWGISLCLFIVLTMLPAQTYAQSASELISPGKLSKAHEKNDNIKSCLKCHIVGKGVPNQKCLECHEKIAKRITLGKGLHGALSEPCFTCHKEHKGRDASITPLDLQTFNHMTTGYALTGGHAKVRSDCKKCHKTKSYLELSRDCRTCHEFKHEDSVSNRLCTDCHTTESWKSVVFDHNITTFALTDSHTTVPCKKCHEKLVFKKQDKTCQGCHTPKHKNQFVEKLCTDCHGTASWQENHFNHDTSRFKLIGRHRQVKCTECHQKHSPNLAKQESFPCTSCHEDKHKGQFQTETALGVPGPEPCSSCHTEEGFKPSTHDHNRLSFKLTGKHEKVECAKCHKEGQFRQTNKACENCHKDKHEGQFTFKIDGEEVQQSCAGCHTTEGFKPPIFEHETARFKREGKHKELECTKCHQNGKFKPIDTNCTNCHEDKHNKQFITENNKHRECSECHTVDGFKPTIFDHERAAFKITGAHKKVECEKCHPKKQFKLAARPSRCADCHEDKHKGSYRGDCTRCHNNESWKLTSDFHVAIFPLQGAHMELA